MSVRKRLVLEFQFFRRSMYRRRGQIFHSPNYLRQALMTYPQPTQLLRQFSLIQRHPFCSAPPPKLSLFNLVDSEELDEQLHIFQRGLGVEYERFVVGKLKGLDGVNAFERGEDTFRSVKTGSNMQDCVEDVGCLRADPRFTEGEWGGE